MAKELGKWAFIIGVVVALILGIVGGIGSSLGATATAWLGLLLVVLGLIVGFSNITAKEATLFLVAAIALLVANTAGLTGLNTLIPYLGSIFAGIVTFLLVMVAPAALVVAVKTFYKLAAE